MKNQMEVEYRVHERAVDKVKGEYAGLLSLDDGFSLLILCISKEKFVYIPLANIIYIKSPDLLTNLEDEDDRSTQ